MFENRTLYWIAIDIANQMGYDKFTFENRIKVVEDNYHELKSLYTKLQLAIKLNVKSLEQPSNSDIDFVNPITPIGALISELKQQPAFAKIESDLEFLNGVSALFETLTTGYSAHMVYLDASNQALQLYAVTTRCRQTAKTCNLANKNEIADAYQLLANELNSQLNYTFTRSDCKKALMTKMYNKEKPAEEIVTARFNDSFTKMTEELGIGFDEFNDIVNDALFNIAPKAIRAMESLSALNDEKIGTYNWTLPDGFKCKYDVKSNQETTINFQTKHGIAFEATYKMKVFQPSDKNRGMSPNMIHSIDGYIVREMIRRMNGKFITTIHDAFACHPSDCDLMVQNYKDILCDLLKSNIIDDIASEVAGTRINLSKSDDLTCEDIQQSVYLLS